MLDMNWIKTKVNQISTDIHSIAKSLAIIANNSYPPDYGKKEAKADDQK